jgi:hypothetical protein
MKGRHSNFTTFSRRVTPREVAQHWFRRGLDFDFRQAYPDFPKPGPDGLLLLSAVEGWFDRFHGHRQLSSNPAMDEEDEAMRAARGH